MAGVILRTAGGTLLFVTFLWLVRIDDWRVAGMMLTFPMLNGIAALVLGWGLCLGCIVSSAKVAPVIAGCAGT